MYTTSKVSYTYIAKFQQTLSVHYKINAFLTELRLHGSKLDQFLHADDDISASELFELHDSLKQQLAEIDRISGDSQEVRFLINALENTLSVYAEKSSFTVSEYWIDENYYPEYANVLRIQTYMERYISQLQNMFISQNRLYYDTLIKQSVSVQILLAVVVAGVFAVMIRFVFVFSKRFTEPIRHLAALSQRMASGDLDVPLLEEESEHGDEVAVLTGSFNKMSRNIKELVDGLNRESQLEKQLHEQELERENALYALRESQLISLQTQIKPHFLFNTLNVICRQAELEGATQTAALMQSLARLFRYNLLSHQQAIPLEQELLAVREYIVLQQTRFGERIGFRMRCTIPTEDVLIPPLVIQTFVENAICHGLEPAIHGGTVGIDIRHRRNRYVFRIFDNGVGMDDTSRRTVMDVTRQMDVQGMDGAVHGIGIRNVLTRLHLYYSGCEKVYLYSKPGRGTLVTISVPEKE